MNQLFEREFYWHAVDLKCVRSLWKYDNMKLAFIRTNHTVDAVIRNFNSSKFVAMRTTSRLCFVGRAGNPYLSLFRYWNAAAENCCYNQNEENVEPHFKPGYEPLMISRIASSCDTIRIRAQSTLKSFSRTELLKNTTLWFLYRHVTRENLCFASGHQWMSKQGSSSDFTLVY